MTIGSNCILTVLVRGISQPCCRSKSMAFRVVEFFRDCSVLLKATVLYTMLCIHVRCIITSRTVISIHHLHVKQCMYARDIYASKTQQYSDTAAMLPIVQQQLLLSLKLHAEGSWSNLLTREKCCLD